VPIHRQNNCVVTYTVDWFETNNSSLAVMHTDNRRQLYFGVDNYSSFGQISTYVQFKSDSCSQIFNSSIKSHTFIVFKCNHGSSSHFIKVHIFLNYLTTIVPGTLQTQYQVFLINILWNVRYEDLHHTTINIGNVWGLLITE